MLNVFISMLIAIAVAAIAVRMGLIAPVESRFEMAARQEVKRFARFIREAKHMAHKAFAKVERSFKRIAMIRMHERHAVAMKS